jgi:hypothetical protein
MLHKNRINELVLVMEARFFDFEVKTEYFNAECL